ncbi:hypothetical protein G4B88_018387 [Cannabis sativa]|uniref:Uncharacterized protein n=1 Tax=Cannabis sativa TaxID=3483 RepID=A0A7J6E015_CANSA|nr:hypothetical protein G4B88_018387 [Cannabis sativa]
MSEGERNAPGPPLAMISKRSSSKAALRTMGKTEALANCMAKRLASSSDIWVGKNGEEEEEERNVFLTIRVMINNNNKRNCWGLGSPSQRDEEGEN